MAELVHALALAGLHVHDLGGLGGVLGLLLGQRIGTDGGVGADEGALLHWIHLLESQVGTVTATPRFS